MSERCDICGKFRKDSELVGMQAEGDEQWLECKKCISESDMERYFPEVENDQN